MKFRNGARLWEDGITPSCAKRLIEYHVEDHRRALSLSAVDRKGNEGADRFEGSVLHLRLTSPMPDVIRVQIRHHHPTTPV